MSGNGGWTGRLLAASIALFATASVPRIEGPSERPSASDLRLVVNVAAPRLDVFVDGEYRRSYPVAVGMAAYPTPTGEYRITHAVWNPWWHPPDRGWAAGASAVPPGPGNPMGRVKMYFLPLYFVHGTPNEGSLGRAASHGCIRMANDDAIELARLVHRHGAAGLSAGEIGLLVDRPGETRTVRLAEPVPLEVVYRRVEVQGGRLMIHPDVYGRGGGALKERAVQALMAAGYASSSIDDDAIEEMVARAEHETASVPIDAVLTGEPVTADG